MPKGKKRCPACKYNNGTRSKKCQSCGTPFTQTYLLKQIREVALLTKSVGGPAKMREVLNTVDELGMKQLQALLEVLESAS